MLSLLFCILRGVEAQPFQSCKVAKTANSPDINLKLVNKQETLKEHGLLGRETVYFDRQIPAFPRNLVPESSTLKMESDGSLEILVMYLANYIHVTSHLIRT